MEFKTNEVKTDLSSRRDVVHKTIFRAMRRYYWEKFDELHADIQITKENFKDLVKEFINSFIINFDSLPPFSNPNVEASQDGILLVMMTIISQQMTKSWYYKMKNQSYNKLLVKIMSKYSYSSWMKLFNNTNFILVASKFFIGEGFTEAKQTIPSIKENIQVYEHAANFFKDICQKKIKI